MRRVFVGLMLISFVLFSDTLAATRTAEGESKTAESHAYFGFAFNYSYDQSPMQLSVCGLPPKGAAESAGLKMGDRIVAIDDRKDFKNAFEVLLHLFAKKPGDTLELRITRGEDVVNVRVVGAEATEDQVSRMRRNLLLAKEEAERHRK